MKTPSPELSMPLSTEYNSAEPGAAHASHSRLLGAAGALLTAGVLTASCGGEKVYDSSNLASAPHGARVDLRPNTRIVFEEIEGAECDKRAIGVNSAARLVVAVESSPRPRRSTRRPKSPKPISTCEGAEVQAETCQTGSTPNNAPETVAVNCVHIDFSRGDFVAATGFEKLTNNQVVVLVKPLTGTVDKD